MRRARSKKARASGAWRYATFAAAAALVAIAVGAGCKEKISQSQCDELVDRYAKLVVTESFPDASPDMIQKEQERERTEARGDDNFKNCTSQVRTEEYKCAMGAKTTIAFEKCIE